MDKKQNDQHQKTKKTLKIIGISLIIFGGVMTAIGLIDFFSSFNSFDMPTKFWCAFVGLPCIGIGSSVTSVAYKQEISRYMKNEGVPVVNEASEELSPAIRSVTTAIKESLNGNDGVVCSCGNRNDKGDKFCSACGKPLQTVCPACGEKAEADDNFCPNCGEKLN